MNNERGFVKELLMPIIISLVLIFAIFAIKNGYINIDFLKSSDNSKKQIPAKSSVDKQHKNQNASTTSVVDSGKHTPIKSSVAKQYKDRNGTIMSVPPTEMYEAFMTQYALNPDKRFIESFSVICDLYWQFQNKADSSNPYHIGKLAYTDKDVLVPIMKNNQNIGEIELSLPLEFDQVMKSLNECLDILNGGNNKTTFNDLEESAQKSVESSVNDFHTMDPRWITLGLIRLQDLWAETPHPRILVAASKGYSMLLFNYYLSSLENADPFAAYSCGLLVFARWLNPSLSAHTIEEEALLAFQMSYKNHVDQLLKSKRKDKLGLHGKILNVYLKGDLNGLKRLQTENPDEFLPNYLLASLYSDMGLFELSEGQTRELWMKYPTLSLTAVEGIHSLDLHETKILTIVYPLVLLAFIEHKVDEETLYSLKTWKERLKTFYGKESYVDVSLSQFDRLLQKWNPLGGTKEKGNAIIVDEQKIKEMYKGLYEEAIYFRFELLLDKWAVIEFAQQYLDSLIAQDGDHPLLLRMQLELKSKVANYKEVDKYCIKVIKDPKTSGPTASYAHSKLSDLLLKLKYAPHVAKKLDNRSFHLYHRGFLLQYLNNYDMAQEAYQTGLSLNKYEFRFYKHLAQVLKEHTPIYKVADELPMNFEIMKKSGAYMAEQKEDVLLFKALEYYKAASRIVPEEKTLAPKIAYVLTKLERYQEAIDLLNQWLEEHGPNDLSAIVRKGQIAHNYLKMDNPQKALEILTSLYPIIEYIGSEEILNHMLVDDVSYSGRILRDIIKKDEHLISEAPDYKTKKLIIKRIIADSIEEKDSNELYFNAILSIREGEITEKLKNLKERVEQINSAIDVGKIENDSLEVFKLKADILVYLNQKVLEKMHSYQAGVMAVFADTYKALGQLEKAENQWKKALERYPNSIWIKEEMAGFYWRQGKDQKAATYISEGRKLSKEFSRWYFNTFKIIFANESEKRITNAAAELMNAGATPWEIGSLGFLFQYDRPEIAFNLIQKKSAQGMMLFLEKQVSLYKVQKKFKGKKKALSYLKKYVRPNQQGPLTMVFFKEGLFEEILTVLDDIKAICPGRHTEFCWLQKLMAWVALENNPTELEEAFQSHYSRSSPDYYHSIGKFILGKITQEELLSMVKNNKQRCEFSYYIGFTERLKGHYAKATNWYHISQETLLSNNGEFHWASNEMFWWAHMGTEKRHRLLNDDVDQYHLKAQELFTSDEIDWEL